ncbi:unnamed protein product [Periconia digitata]|uniref:Uncharacterized protein n=1 Tax=Periconia digitata TaxID=1303443 RepID=A0A9W4XVS6_9PLEO|nr:unnamed protein product [Periconia digitata]
MFHKIAILLDNESLQALRLTSKTLLDRADYQFSKRYLQEVSVLFHPDDLGRLVHLSHESGFAGVIQSVMICIPHHNSLATWQLLVFQEDTLLELGSQLCQALERFTNIKVVTVADINAPGWIEPPLYRRIQDLVEISTRAQYRTILSPLNLRKILMDALTNFTKKKDELDLHITSNFVAAGFCEKDCESTALWNGWAPYIDRFTWGYSNPHVYHAADEYWFEDPLPNMKPKTLVVKDFGVLCPIICSPLPRTNLRMGIAPPEKLLRLQKLELSCVSVPHVSLMDLLNRTELHIIKFVGFNLESERQPISTTGTEWDFESWVKIWTRMLKNEDLQSLHFSNISRDCRDLENDWDLKPPQLASSHSGWEGHILVKEKLQGLIKTYQPARFPEWRHLFWVDLCFWEKQATDNETDTSGWMEDLSAQHISTKGYRDAVDPRLDYYTPDDAIQGCPDIF